MKEMKVSTISEWTDADYTRCTSQCTFSSHVALATTLRTRGVSLFEMQIPIEFFNALCLSGCLYLFPYINFNSCSLLAFCLTAGPRRRVN